MDRRFALRLIVFCAAVLGAYYAVVALVPGTLPGVAGGDRIEAAILVTDTMFVLLAFGAAAAVVVGVRRNRPRNPRAWYLQAVGLAFWGTGDAIYVVTEDVLHSTPSPSAADVAYLVSYPFLAVGLAGIARSRRKGRDVGGLIDSAVFSLGVLSAAWVFLIQPGLTDTSMSSAGRLVTAAYPVMDVILLGTLVRLMTGPAARLFALWLLAAAAGWFLVADVTFSVSTVLGVDTDVEASGLWLLGYITWAAAALHPSMADLARRGSAQAARLSGRRIVGVTVAAMVPAATLVLSHLHGDAIQVWPIAIFWVLLFSLVMLRIVGLTRRLEQQREELARVARTDALTGLPNRRSADAELRRCVRHAGSTGVPLVLAVVDLDHFKQYNDRFGHPAGDALLVSAAEGWSAGLRRPAFLARHGGEEFLVIVPGGAAQHAERTLAMMRTALPDGVTLSAGVARWDGDEDAARLMARADAALYAAKAAGRDRVEWADDLPGAVDDDTTATEAPAGV